MRESSGGLSRFFLELDLHNRHRVRRGRDRVHCGDAAGEVLGVPPPALHDENLPRAWPDTPPPATPRVRKAAELRSLRGSRGQQPWRRTASSPFPAAIRHATPWIGCSPRSPSAT